MFVPNGERVIDQEYRSWTINDVNLNGNLLVRVYVFEGALQWKLSNHLNIGLRIEGLSTAKEHQIIYYTYRLYHGWGGGVEP